MDTKYAIGTIWEDDIGCRLKIIAHVSGNMPIVAVVLNVGGKTDTDTGVVRRFSPDGRFVESGASSRCDLVKQILPLKEILLYVHRDTGLVRVDRPMPEWHHMYDRALFREVRDEPA